MDRTSLGVGVVVLAVLGGSLAAADSSAAFQSRALGPGVWLFRPVDEPTRRVNSLVVEQDHGLLVVEAQPDPSAARDLLASIATVTRKPVRFLALSHPHVEVAGGAAAFAAGVVVVANQAYAAAIADPQYDFGAEARARSADPKAWTEPARRSPDLLVYGRTDLADSRNPVQLLAMPQAHSRADLVVRLDTLDLTYVGGLISPERDPFPGDAVVKSWLGALNNISREAPALVVAQRGDLLGVADVRRQRDALAWLRGQVESGFADQLPLESIPPRVLATAGIEERFDPSAPRSFLPSLIQRVVDESAHERVKRGAQLPPARPGGS